MASTLPETNIAPDNRPGSKRKLIFQPQCLRCYHLLVSGRVVQNKNLFIPSCVFPLFLLLSLSTLDTHLVRFVGFTKSDHKNKILQRDDVGWQQINSLSTGGFLKWWGNPQQPWGFPTKNDHDLGCEMGGGTHHLRKHPSGTGFLKHQRTYVSKFEKTDAPP